MPRSHSARAAALPMTMAMSYHKSSYRTFSNTRAMMSDKTAQPASKRILLYMRLLLLSFAFVPRADAFTSTYPRSSTAPSTYSIACERLSSGKSTLLAANNDENDLLRRENDVLKREMALLTTGNSAASGLDIDREVIRLDSFDNYVLVSALISTCSLSTLVFFQPIDDPMMELEFPQNGLCLLTQLTAVVGTMSSTLATVIFALEELYGRSAIGMTRDESYQRFLDKTEGTRNVGFKAFSASVVIFALQTGLVGIERVRGIPNKSIAAVVALIGIFLINSSWNDSVSAATEIYEKEEYAKEP